jgi:hypothetical protein
MDIAAAATARQRNRQGLADLTCTTDKTDVKFRGVLQDAEYSKLTLYCLYSEKHS